MNANGRALAVRSLPEVSDDELSVRLEWPERSNEPFRPPSDEPDRRLDQGTDTGEADLAGLRRAVAELRAELADLRAQVERLTDAGDVGSMDVTPRSSRREAVDPPRPINVRSRGRKAR